MFLKGRNLNYRFAFVESAWILEGRNDLDILSRYISTYSQYSDDNKTLNGAYGYRLRHYFDQDQIEGAINHLQKILSPDELYYKSTLLMICKRIQKIFPVIQTFILRLAMVALT